MENKGNKMRQRIKCFFGFHTADVQKTEYINNQRWAMCIHCSKYFRMIKVISPLIILLLLSIMGFGQDTLQTSNLIYQEVIETADSNAFKLCEKRGHVRSGVYSSTLLYCPSYIIDTDSTTIEVFPSCNWIGYTCSRCGKQISEREKERRIVIWKRDK
jgi:hypothetical protein